MSDVEKFQRLVVRGEEPKDIIAIRRLITEAFGGEKEANLIDRLRKEGRFLPRMSIVIETQHDELIGHILLSSIECVTDKGSVKTGAIGPGAVKEGHKNLRVAHSLMKALMIEAQRLEFELLTLLGRPHVYERIGFSAVLAQRIECVYSGKGDSFMALELKKGVISGSRWAKATFPGAFSECDGLESTDQGLSLRSELASASRNPVIQP